MFLKVQNRTYSYILYLTYDIAYGPEFPQQKTSFQNRLNLEKARITDKKPVFACPKVGDWTKFATRSEVLFRNASKVW